MKAKKKYLKFKGSWATGKWLKRHLQLRTTRWRKHKKAA